MKKILVFVDWFHPGFKGGGPIQSCYNLVLALSGSHDISVVTRDSDMGEADAYPYIKPDIWTEHPNGFRINYLSKAHMNFNNIRRLILETLPDHIYINSMFSKFFTIWPLLANKFDREIQHKVQFTIAPRGMLLDSALDKKSAKKKLFFLLASSLYRHSNIRFHATNEKEASSVKKKFPGRVIFVAANLPEGSQEPFEDIEKQPHSLKLIYLARIDPIKNLLLLLEILKGCRSSIQLTIAGPVDDQDYWRVCCEAIKGLPSNVQAEYIGPVAKSGIIHQMQKAHMYVLPSRGENFGHSIFEAFLSGRPVLISDQTPWRDLKNKNVGFDIPLVEIDAFRNAIEIAASWDQVNYDRVAGESWQFAKAYLANDQSKLKYEEIFR